MTPIEPGFFALSLLATLIAGGFIVIIVTKLFAVWEERVFWKRYDRLAHEESSRKSLEAAERETYERLKLKFEGVQNDQL